MPPSLRGIAQKAYAEASHAEEPGARKPHAGICAGPLGNWRSYRDGAFHLVNLYTNALDRCFIWRYSDAYTMEDDALWQ